MLQHIPGIDNRPANRLLARPLSRRALFVAGAAAAAALIDPTAAGAATETGWRFCPKCRGLFFGQGKKSAGVCPAGGKHKPQLAGNYVLTYDLPTQIDLYQNWRRCQKCRGLFADDLGDTGVCPAGGSHGGLARSYALWQGATTPGMDDAWDECLNCYGLFNWAGGFAGSCPDGGGHVRRNAGDRYTLFVLV